MVSVAGGGDIVAIVRRRGSGEDDGIRSVQSCETDELNSELVPIVVGVLKNAMMTDDEVVRRIIRTVAVSVRRTDGPTAGMRDCAHKKGLYCN